MTKRITAAERRFARRVMRRAAAIAARSGRPLDNQRVLWRLVWDASREPKRKR